MLESKSKIDKVVIDISKTQNLETGKKLRIPKVAIYTRVSTSDQNTDMQISDLTEYAQKRGWVIYEAYRLFLNQNER